MQHSQGQDYMLGQKTSFNKLKKTETISSIFSDHNRRKLDINYETAGKKSQMCED